MYETASLPWLVNAAHCQYWSVVPCPWPVVTGSFRTFVDVPANDAPPSEDVLITMSLLQPPEPFTPSYVGLPVSANPVGVQPLDSFESRLRYEPNTTATSFGSFGLTTPVEMLVARKI